MNPVRRFVERVVGDRCPADPCASENGLKMRVMAIVLVPPAVAILGAGALTPPQSTVSQAALVVSVTWAALAMLAIPPAINSMEPCDEVETHHGEGSTS
jgi:hypothetical protein